MHVHDRLASLGASGLSGARPAAQPAAAPGPGGRGCTGLDRPAHHAAAAVRAFRFPSHHGPAAGRGLAREPQAGGAPLAPGGPPGAPQAPAPAAPLGDRRLLPAAPRASVRIPSGPTPASANGRTTVGHCGCSPSGTSTRGSASASMSRAACGPTTSWRAARRSSCGTARQLPALGPRPRVHGDSGAVLAPPAGRHDTLHRTRPSLGERRRGILPRHAPRRAPQPRDLHDPHRSPGPHRPLAARGQPGAPAQRPRVPAARPGRAGGRTAPPHALGSPEGSHTNLASGTTIGGRSAQLAGEP